jgi:hypothetical protein
VKIQNRQEAFLTMGSNLLQQGIKLLDGYLRSLKNVRQRASFYRTVSGHCDFQHAFGSSLLETNVTSPLSNDHKPGSLKRFDNPVKR